MYHYRGGARTEIVKNPFNNPIRVGLFVRLEPLLDRTGVRNGSITVTIGDEELRSFRMDVEAQPNRMFVKRLSARGVAIRIEALDDTVRPFMRAVQRRVEEEWGRIFSSLESNTLGRTGHAQIVILPGEWGQNHDERVVVPWVTIVNTPMGGQPRSH